MGKKPKPFITRLQAEGTTSEKLLLQRELQKEAERLAIGMPTFPPERQVYVLNLLQRVLRNELDKEVFKLFVKITNSYLEVEACSKRAELLAKKRREVTNVHICKH